MSTHRLLNIRFAVKYEGIGSLTFIEFIVGNGLNEG